MARVLFSVVRNEAPFLLEWIAYNLQLGFDKIVIYSNNCTDGTDTLLDELAAHGVLTHVRHDPVGRSPQGHALLLFRKSNVLAEGDWCMFMDPDEFLNIKVGGRRLDDLIAFIGGYQGMTVAWRLFGDSGHNRLAGRLISSHYTMASAIRPRGGRSVKTLFKVGNGYKSIRIHSPIFTEEFWQGEKTFLLCDGKPVDLNEPRYKAWKDGEIFANVGRAQLSYDFAQINHYQLRSIAALRLKYLRGDGGRADGSSAKYSPDAISGFNTNEVHDDTVLFYQTATDERRRHLLGLGELAKLDEAAQAAYRNFEDRYLDQLQSNDNPPNGAGNLASSASPVAPRANSEKKWPGGGMLRRFSKQKQAAQAIVHIGQMKTGTTAFRERMHRNREMLHAQGIIYPESELFVHTAHDLTAFLVEKDKLPFQLLERSNGSRSAALEAAENVAQKIEQRVAEVDEGVLVYCSELISGMASPEVVGRLHKLMDRFSRDTRYICYVRSPIAGMMSRLQQSLLINTLLREARWQLQVTKMLHFKERFGDRFSLRVFSRDELHNGDITEDIFHRDLPGKVAPPPPNGPRVPNQSHSAEAMYLQQRVKLTLRPDGTSIVSPVTRALFEMLKKKDQTVDGFAPPRIKAELVGPLMRAQTDARRLKREFGIKFDDIDYGEIGKPHDLDFEALRYVENICDVNPDRVRAMISSVVDDPKTDPEVLALLKNAKWDWSRLSRNRPA